MSSVGEPSKVISSLGTSPLVASQASNPPAHPVGLQGPEDVRGVERTPPCRHRLLPKKTATPPDGREALQLGEIRYELLDVCADVERRPYPAEVDDSGDCAILVDSAEVETPVAPVESRAELYQAVYTG